MSEARTLRLFHPARTDRVVRVTAQSEGAHTFLCVARGADAHPSTVTERIGPFLAGELAFPAISDVIAATMAAHRATPVDTLAAVRAVDAWAKAHAADEVRAVVWKGR